MMILCQLCTKKQYSEFRPSKCSIEFEGNQDQNHNDMQSKSVLYSMFKLYMCLLKSTDFHMLSLMWNRRPLGAAIIRPLLSVLRSRPVSRAPFQMPVLCVLAKRNSCSLTRSRNRQHQFSPVVGHIAYLLHFSYTPSSRRVFLYQPNVPPKRNFGNFYRNYPIIINYSNVKPISTQIQSVCASIVAKIEPPNNIYA